MLRVIYIDMGNQIYELHTYPLMLGLALCFAIIFLPYTFKKVGLAFDKRIMALISIIIFALLFARGVYFILYPQQLNSLKQLFEFKAHNFTLYGGILGALLTVLILSKLWDFSLLKWMDHTIIVVSGSLLLSRIGCLLNGCCFGKVTKMPWGIPMTKDSLAYYAYIQENPLSLFGKLPKIHYTQLYEIIVILVAIGVALMIRNKNAYNRVDGLPAIAFGITLTAGRFIVFFFRDFPYATQLSNYIRGPIIYGIALIVQLFILRRLLIHRKKGEDYS